MLAAVEGAPVILPVVSKVLTIAYLQLGIQIEIQEYPGLRALRYSNNGKTDGEAFRVVGIDKKYPNLIRVEVPLVTNMHYLFVKQGKEFVVEDWSSIPKNYVLGIKRGVQITNYSAEKYSIKKDVVSNSNQLLRKLDLGRNDVIVLTAFEASKGIQQLELSDIIRLEPPIDTHYLYHYLHKKHIGLVPKITAVLKAMEANGKIKKIQENLAADIAL